MQIVKTLTVNRHRRPSNCRVNSIVIHQTAGRFEGTHPWILNPTSKISYHFVVPKDAPIHQYVRLSDSAWHAGLCTTEQAKRFYGRENPNDLSIGISLELEGTENPTLRQYLDTALLIDGICRTLKLKHTKISCVPHRWIRDDKTCPGSTKVSTILEYFHYIRKITSEGYMNVKIMA